MTKPIINRKRIRLKVNADKDSTAMQDVLLGGTPLLARGNDVQFEIGVFWNDLVADLVYVASMTLTVKNSNDLDGDALMSQTINAGDINNDLTAEEWAAATAAHAEIPFTAQETNFAAGNYHLAVAIITNHTPGREITLGKTTLTIWDDGIGSALPAELNPAQFYSRAEADARYQQQHADNASVAFKLGRDQYIYCPDDGIWYPVGVKLIDGQATLSLGDGEELT